MHGTIGPNSAASPVQAGASLSHAFLQRDTRRRAAVVPTWLCQRQAKADVHGFRRFHTSTAAFSMPLPCIG